MNCLSRYLSRCWRNILFVEQISLEYINTLSHHNFLHKRRGSKKVSSKGCSWIWTAWDNMPNSFVDFYFILKDIDCIVEQAMAKIKAPNPQHCIPIAKRKRVDFQRKLEPETCLCCVFKLFEWAFFFHSKILSAL